MEMPGSCYDIGNLESYQQARRIIRGSTSEHWAASHRDPRVGKGADADVTALERDFGFKPATSLREGLRKFAEWYKAFYKV